MRTELKITTMKEQILKVKMVDMKSVIEHFRAFFVHISRQQIKPCQPHVLFITMEVGTHSKKLKQILELTSCHLSNPHHPHAADVKGRQVNASEIKATQHISFL